LQAGLPPRAWHYRTFAMTCATMPGCSRPPAEDGTETRTLPRLANPSGAPACHRETLEAESVRRSGTAVLVVSREARSALRLSLRGALATRQSDPGRCLSRIAASQVLLAMTTDRGRLGKMRTAGSGRTASGTHGARRPLQFSCFLACQRLPIVMDRRFLASYRGTFACIGDPDEPVHDVQVTRPAKWKRLFRRSNWLLLACATPSSSPTPNAR
jgi:hypothetical protein